MSVLVQLPLRRFVNNLIRMSGQVYMLMSFLGGLGPDFIAHGLKICIIATDGCQYICIRHWSKDLQDRVGGSIESCHSGLDQWCRWVRLSGRRERLMNATAESGFTGRLTSLVRCYRRPCCSFEASPFTTADQDSIAIGLDTCLHLRCKIVIVTPRQGHSIHAITVTVSSHHWRL